MTEMSEYLINQLQPEKIGILFEDANPSGDLTTAGNEQSTFFDGIFGLEKFRPRNRFLLISLAWIIVILAVGLCDHALVAPPGVPTVIQVLINPENPPHEISLALLQDPIAIIAISMTLATPILCAEQVRAIKIFNAMNENNITYRMHSLDAFAINERVAKANKKFEMLGRTGSSALLLGASLAVSFVIDLLLYHAGLFAGWNYTSLSDTTWRQEVYKGWWANFPEHLPMAIVLWLLGGYLFYFLSKQLWMGFAFATYARQTMLLDFCVSPNMRTNTDGYLGLRPLRHFMQTTYGSTLGHFTMVLGILVVWLPFSVYTVLAVIAVLITNLLVVIYPSVIASSGAVIEKKRYVAHVAVSSRPRADRDAVIDKVWAAPNLPFHLRSSFTAATLYLLIPLLLAVVSGLLGK
jgi:hypothetical protein